MTDVETRLHTLATHVAAAPEPGDDTVRADLARGRQARRRRSVRLAGTALALVAVAGVGTAVIVSGEAGDPAPAEQQRVPAAAGGTGRGAVGTQQPAALRLVAWTGEQLPGFEVARVPEGFVLEGATPLSLTVARADDTSGVDVFADKLAVMLESADATGAPQGDPVEVGDSGVGCARPRAAPGCSPTSTASTGSWCRPGAASG